MTVDRVVRLTERRPAVLRVPPADLDDLLRHFRRHIEVTPTMVRGRYRVTPRGVVGTFRTSNRVWEVRPKFGWDSVRYLLGGVPAMPAPLGAPERPAALASVFAFRLANLMTERAAAGLVRGYAERVARSDTVRGRIDLPRQLREGGPTPGRFHVVVDDFTTDVVWNQVAVSAAGSLAEVPGLDPAARAALRRALEVFPGVTPRAFPSGDLSANTFDSRTESYRPLVEWCRALAASEGGFLLNLEHLFQCHVTDLLVASPLRGRATRPVMPTRLSDPTNSVAPLTLVPDVTTVDASGAPTAVWDMKWKPLGPDGPDERDLHQVLGYAAVTGVRYAGLVYPGRRFAARIYESAAAGWARVGVLTHRVTGTPAQHARSARRLVRAVLRPERLFAR